MIATIVGAACPVLSLAALLGVIILCTGANAAQPVGYPGEQAPDLVHPEPSPPASRPDQVGEPCAQHPAAPVGRAFRLHLRHRVFDGWVTANGEAVAIEDQELGLTAAAATLGDLIRGYGGGRIEWLPPRTQHTEQHEGGRQR